MSAALSPELDAQPGEVHEPRGPAATRRLLAYEAALAYVSDGVAFEVGDERFHNTAWARLLGLPRQDPQRPLSWPVRPDQRESATRAIRAGQVFSGEVQLARADGTPIDVDAVALALPSKDGGAPGALWVARDPADAARSQRTLRDALWTAERTIHAAGLGHWWWDEETGLLWASGACLAQWSQPAEPIEAPGLWWLQHVHSDDRPLLAFELSRMLAAGSGRLEMEYRHRAADGHVAWRWLRALAVAGPEGYGRRILGAQLDIDTRRAEEERNRASSLCDSLTGLPNRVVFHDRLAHALRGLSRAADQRVFVLFIDLDAFKPINDRFGHHAGDEVLRQVAVRLQGALRQGDTVARIGGDEFAIVLSCRGPSECEEQVAEIVKRLRASVEGPIPFEGTELRVGASIGIASADSPHTSAETLLRSADHAMYLEKSVRTSRPSSGPMRAVVRSG